LLGEGRHGEGMWSVFKLWWKRGVRLKLGIR
jgi:hypothetical protein